jgi:hypothetical protein
VCRSRCEEKRVKVTACRICRKEPLELVLDYGHVALADGFLDDPSGFASEEKYPLALVLCQSCGHLQIDEIVSPELLFRNYVYLTGVSETVLRHARELYDAVVTAHGGRPQQVIEAASNDGTVLSVWKEHGCRVLGIDPARNIAKIANERGIETIAEFFNRQTATDVAARFPKADVLMARNVLAHVADLHGFVEGITILLAPDGLGVIEVPHALTMFDTLEYDQVFHEHIGYYTVGSLQTLFALHGLRVVRVEEIAIHGGSVRVYVAPDASARRPDESVARVVAAEEQRGLHTLAAWRAFAARAHQQKEALVAELTELKRQKKRIAAYGASGKGQSMLQFCGIDGRLLDYVVDKSSLKQGKWTPGSHLPVHPTERLLQDRPDVVLLSAWNFADEIRRQQAAYVEQGGRMLHPLPMPHYLP